MNLIGLLMLFSAAFWLPAGINAPSAAAQATNAPCVTFEVEAPGESLAAVAERCGVSLVDLSRANPHLAPHFSGPARLPAGVVVYLPVGLVPVTAAAPETPEAAASVSYRVRSGDNLTRLARQAGLSLGQLLYANPDINNPDLIHAGQQILLPAPGGPERDLAQWRQDRLSQSVQAMQQSGAGSRVRGPDERWILVDLATQTTHAYEGDRLVRSFLVSTGRSQTPTVTGEFNVWIRLRYDDMSGPGYNLKDVPYVMYFHQGYGLHGTYWHSNFGTPMSHGCVNLRTEDAGWLYEWASVGTPVVVR